MLFQKSVRYLGHIVSARGIEADPDKVERVCDWPVPGNATDVKSLLGLASYYRRFIPSFALVARPLYKLTEAHVEIAWTPDCPVVI